MPPLRTLVIGTGLAALPALYIRSRILALERAYPALPPEHTTTPQLRAPRAPGRRVADVDVYAARVPVAALLRASGAAEAALEDAWARAFFQARTMRLEAALAGCGDAGDMGAHGFRPGQRIVANIMHVLRAPAPGAPLLIEWDMPRPAVRFFETIAAWGYPWRLMEGGCQEWGVGPVSRLPGEAEDMVEVRYAAMHDYKIVDGEKEPGKIIPQWVVRAHRAYARYLLDEAARGIREKAAL